MSKNVKYIILISILFALLDKIWFEVPFASKRYNNTVSKIQGSEIDPTGRKIYGVIAYLIMGLVFIESFNCGFNYGLVNYGPD